ncbi:MAG: protein arginine N-methyltransferase [Roseivirga sp.]
MNDAMQAQQQLMQAIRTYQTGDLIKAENELKSLLNNFPKSDQIMSVLGAVLFGQKKYKEAYRQYKDALKINANNPDAAMGIASAEHARGNTENAISLMKKALDNFPKRIEAHFNLGTFYIDQDEMEKAKACFLKCLELEPKLAQADLHLVNIYKELNDLEKVEHHLRKVIAVNPDPSLKEKLREVIELKGGSITAEASPAQARAVKEPASGEPKVHEPTINKVLGVDNDDVEGLLAIAAAFLERHQHNEAAKYYEQVLAIDPENSTAGLALRKIKAASVPLWHFEMLADTDRNDAYQEAIERALSKQPNARVLDIGTGSGLLAMMAARAGASEVLACEMNTEIAKVAGEIVERNGYKDQVKVLNVKSSDLKPGLDYQGKYDIVVSEILDVAGIGEGVLPSLRHAYQSILKPGAVTVPSGMTMYAQLVSLPEFSKVNPINMISGFDLSPFNIFSSPDQYLPVKLSSLDHEFLSAPVAFYSFDFSNIPEEREASNPHTAEVDFEVVKKGSAHAVAFWFELHLDDQLTLSSGLGGKLKHWGQAICFMHGELAVSQGETIPMTAKFLDNTMWFEARND